jgi:hypothetical protein
MPRSAAVLVLLITASLHANPITDENARPGTSEWQHRQPSQDIAGYASATSVAAGDSLGFHVSTSDASFRLEVFRTGWYGGLGARRMTDGVVAGGVEQPPCPPDDESGLVRCRWSESYSLAIPAGWLSGVYLAKLTGAPSGNQSYVMFVVRDQRRADFVFQSAVTTYQAYNDWGGKSLYAFNSIGGAATRVSFDRPYASAFGTGGYLFQWEYNMVRFLEREGYDVTYTTSLDTDASAASLQRASAFLSVGHDEYWTREMREHVEAARDAGIDVGFFGANVCYWRIRLEDGGRTIVGYKETALTADPFAIDSDPANDDRITTLWRDSEPEESLVGAMYGESQIDGDIVVDDDSHWVFAGTGLRRGDRLAGLLGYEVDAIHGIASPPGVTRLAHSPYVNTHGETGWSDMTIYTAPSGAIVFATGTIQWSWGLDSFAGRDTRQSEAARQITRNVLNRMIDVPRRRAVRH